MREMDRAARAGSSRMTKEQSISQLQKMANAEYFKDGGGPLFPGSHLHPDSSFSPLHSLVGEAFHSWILLWQRYSVAPRQQLSCQ
jgi:hypothetical protein